LGIFWYFLFINPQPDKFPFFGHAWNYLVN